MLITIITISIIFAESIGYNTFKNRNKLARWYEAVREELGPYYTDVQKEFEAKLKLTNDAAQGEKQAQAVKQ